MLPHVGDRFPAGDDQILALPPHSEQSVVQKPMMQGAQDDEIPDLVASAAGPLLQVMQVNP